MGQMGYIVKPYLTGYIKEQSVFTGSYNSPQPLRFEWETHVYNPHLFTG